MGEGHQKKSNPVFPLPAGTPPDVDMSLQDQRARPDGYPHLPRKKLAMGSNPSSYGGGIGNPLGPLMLILLLICSETQADSCWKCYQNLYFGKTRGSYLVAHTHISSVMIQRD